MAYGKKRRSGDSSREQGGFIALPWAVVDSVAYGRLSHPARALLVEIARQILPDNNGRLLASGAYLAKRGWTSNAVITRALRALIDAKLIHQTVQGHRPNKASWYAVTWRTLDPHPGYDAGAADGFRRGAYRDGEPLPVKLTREQLYRKWDKPQNASLTPSGGVEEASIAPSGGVEPSPIAPSGGAMEATFTPSPTPSDGDHLEITISRRRKPQRAATGNSATAMKVTKQRAAQSSRKRNAEGLSAQA